jgi:GDP-mannose transporter
MNFLLLCIQSLVCVLCVSTVKRLGIISFRNFDMADAKEWFPVSCLLVAVIYTGSKSLVSPTKRALPSRRQPWD